MKYPLRIMASVSEADKPYALQVLGKQVGEEAQGCFGVPCLTILGARHWVMSSLVTQRDSDALIWFQTSGDNPLPPIATLKYIIWNDQTGVVEGTSGGPLALLASPFYGLEAFLLALGLTLEFPDVIALPLP